MSRDLTRRRVVQEGTLLDPSAGLDGGDDEETIRALSKMSIARLGAIPRQSPSVERLITEALSRKMGFT
jgi:hypothetical protein